MKILLNFKINLLYQMAHKMHILSNMVICPQCNIEHSPEEEFCNICGKFLLTIEDSLVNEEIEMIRLICPRCRTLYKKGHYCKKCGSLLQEEKAPQEKETQTLQKKSVKKLSKKWLRLLEEKKEIETCLNKLEGQRNKVSSDLINPLSSHYQDRFNSLLPLHQEMDIELQSIKKGTTEEIHSLEKELQSLSKRLEEFQSLYETGAVTKKDYSCERKKMRREIKLKEKGIKKYQEILSSLPREMGGKTIHQQLIWHNHWPYILIAGSMLFLLLGGGGYFLWWRTPPLEKPTLNETLMPPLPSSQELDANQIEEAKEIEKIRLLFENIRQANLHKDINRFMSCFSKDFKGIEEKRSDTLKMWENYDYLSLSYELKGKTISTNIAQIKLEWLVRTSMKLNGQLQNGKSLIDVTLKKEGDHWKIIEIKQIS